MTGKIFVMLFFILSIIRAQDKRIDIIIENIIGDDINARKEYIFQGPEIIRTDSRNNIYVADKKSFEIRKFSKEGKYILSIGRAGDGPGEFRNIKNLTVDNQDHVIVIDQILGRITTFSPEGKYMASDNIKSEFRDVSKLISYNNNEFIGLQLFSLKYGEHGNKIVIIDNSFKNILTSFAHTSIFWKYENDFEKFMETFSMLNFLVVNNDRVVVTKEIYDGNLYVFDKKNNWSVRVVKSGISLPKQYEIYKEIIKMDDKRMKLGRAFLTSMKINDKLQMYTFIVSTRSLGLFNYKNKYLLNFINVCKNDNSVFGLEVHSIDGTYLGYCHINIENLPKYGPANFVLYMDNENSFYMKSYSKESIPVIVKFKIKKLEGF